MDRWVRTDRPRRERPATDRPGPTSRAASAVGLDVETAVPAEVATAIRGAAGTANARNTEALVERMAGAAAAYDRHRFQDALRLGQQVAREVPSVAAVRRLVGFSAYRLGRWREAVRHLDAYGELSGEVDAVPALMDCQRALGRPARVSELWRDLRQRSPDADVLTEARIVAAATLADGGELAEAIDLLSGAGAARALRNPSDRHVRQWYVLGDLYERVGDVPRARQLFERVERADPGAYDVEERLEALGTAQGPSRRRVRRR